MLNREAQGAGEKKRTAAYGLALPRTMLMCRRVLYTPPVLVGEERTCNCVAPTSQGRPSISRVSFGRAQHLMVPEHASAHAIAFERAGWQTVNLPHVRLFSALGFLVSLL